MPLQATSGAASYDAFGGGVPVVPNYIEDVFSTYLYTGNGSSQTITNGIDLSGKGGLVWFKRRSTAISHALFDSARSSTSNALFTNTTGAQVSSYGVTFNSNGVSLGQSEPEHNSNGETYVSWTFRKQPKFFDVVTYTGDGTGPRAISHNLGSTPGCIFVKRTSGSQNWEVYHRSLTSNQYYLELNQTSAQDDSGQSWDVTSTTFNANSNLSLNTNGATYVAYLFAHNAGGFGLTGTDNVITCGTFTTDGSGFASVNLGYEAQWFMHKSISVGNWNIEDVMRGSSMSTYAVLAANTSGAESAASGIGSFPQATGVRFATGAASTTYIYIAIRRGPMKVPTSGTSVYNGITRTGTGAATNITGAGFPIDLLIQHERATANNIWTTDRLRGTLSNLDTQSTAAENTNSFFQFDKQDGFGLVGAGANVSGRTMIDWVFRRAPSAFDVVCYSGLPIDPGTIYHNLGVPPELIIVKRRNGVAFWPVYAAPLGVDTYAVLNNNSNVSSPFGYWGGTTPTSTYFNISQSSNTFESGGTFVAYLFATCAGVSKVGSYTGTGTTLQVNCGFTGGARFVLIKRTDDTGDWYVWDTARGMVSGNDPYVLLNSAAVEVTNTDYVDTYSAGFEISSTAPAAINANGGTFIFLAIA